MGAVISTNKGQKIGHNYFYKGNLAIDDSLVRVKTTQFKGNLARED